MVDRTDPDNDAEPSSEGGSPAGEGFAADRCNDSSIMSGIVESPASLPRPSRQSESTGQSVASKQARPTERFSPFGAALKPVLEQACEGRLRSLAWFRTDWQRGGALTGYAMYDADDGQSHPVVVKLPVPPIERYWLTQLQGGDITPRVYAQGDQLGGYDMAWVVMERLAHGPISHLWGPEAIDLVVDAACRFYAKAADAQLRRPKASSKDWQAILKQSRDSIGNHTADRQRWKDALKKADKRLAGWLNVWDDRDVDAWCHGDLHLGNAMSREPAPQGPALLLDFARSRPGHWVEDAVYFESLFWACREKLGERRLCSMIAKGRRNLGLSSDDNWAELANIRRALLAMSAPAMSHETAESTYFAACLEQLERSSA